MQAQWASFGIGFVAGLRSMTACAALSWATSLGRTRSEWIPASPEARAIASTMALAEMAGDKMPDAPDRRIPPSIAARLAIGAIGGAALAGRDAVSFNAPLMGMAGAVAGTLLGRRARGATTRSPVGLARGLTEDIVAVGLAMMLVHLAGRKSSHVVRPTASSPGDWHHGSADASGRNSRADDVSGDDGTREIAPDLAYRRLLMVNVVFYGRPDAGDRGWVLVDTGVVGTKSFIVSAAEARFGKGARPAAIVLTHGHFDHVGALEDLAAEWDVPVYAHKIEHPYLDGTAAYPPGDPEVGGGLMARLSPLYPTKPVDVSTRLQALPEDGTVPEMPGWCWIHTPGHSAGHVSLWRKSDRTLIAGDAFVTTAAESVYATVTQAPELHGPPRYYTVDWSAARASVETLARLEPELVISGHGRAMRGPVLRDALKALARDFNHVAVPDHGRYLDRPAKAEDGTAYHPVSRPLGAG